MDDKTNQLDCVCEYRHTRKMDESWNEQWLVDEFPLVYPLVTSIKYPWTIHKLAIK